MFDLATMAISNTMVDDPWSFEPSLLEEIEYAKSINISSADLDVAITRKLPTP